MVVEYNERSAEEAICRECYGYQRGGGWLPIMFFINPIGFYLKSASNYMGFLSHFLCTEKDK